jgi:hypothetical protein
MTKKTNGRTAKVAPTISFGQWVKEIAKARGPEGELVRELRESKSVTVKTPLKSAEAKLAAKSGFAKLVSRYNLYIKRGPAVKKAA